VKHDEPLTERPAGPSGTGPQESPASLLPEDLPPGAVYYEKRDVDARPVLKAVAVVIGGTILIVAALLPAFLWLRSRAERAEPAPPPMGRHEPGRVPEGPRLQTTPVQDLAAVQAEDQRLLSSYGWVDEQKGIVHVPIDVAMRKVAERGLAAAGAAPSPSPSPGAASPGPPAGGVR
jgi:hypothetical protein